MQVTKISKLPCDYLFCTVLSIAKNEYAELMICFMMMENIMSVKFLKNMKQAILLSIKSADSLEF